MGTSVLLVFLLPIMVAEFVFSRIFSLFGIDFDALVSWFGSTEATDAFLTLFARVYNTVEPVVRPIIEMLSEFI